MVSPRAVPTMVARWSPHVGSPLAIVDAPDGKDDEGCHDGQDFKRTRDPCMTPPERGGTVQVGHG